MPKRIDMSDLGDDNVILKEVNKQSLYLIQINQGKSSMKNLAELKTNDGCFAKSFKWDVAEADKNHDKQLSYNEIHQNLFTFFTFIRIVTSFSYIFIIFNLTLFAHNPTFSQFSLMLRKTLYHGLIIIQNINKSTCSFKCGTHFKY